MLDLVKVTLLHRHIASEAIPIISVNIGKLVILDNAAPAQAIRADEIASAFDTLILSVSGNVITSPPLTSFDYAIYSADTMAQISSGNVPDGSLELVGDPGYYIVEIISGDATGYAEVQL